MSAERIAKLESLLARINSRAGEARTTGVVAIAAPKAAGSAPRVQTPPPMRAVAPSSPDVSVETSEEYIDESEIDGTTHTVDVDVDEPQPLAHTDEVAVPHIAAQGHHAQEEEEAPASSKRPIAAAPVEEEEEQAPVTPPPESGRQVAAPESARRPSRPPTQEETSGWREPGLPKPGAAAAPPAPPPVPVSAARPIGAPPPVVPGAAPAQVMRPQLAQTDDVAKIEGHVAQPQPSSFGELLDDSLDL